MLVLSVDKHADQQTAFTGVVHFSTIVLADILVYIFFYSYRPALRNTYLRFHIAFTVLSSFKASTLSGSFDDIICLSSFFVHFLIFSKTPQRFYILLDIRVYIFFYSRSFFINDFKSISSAFALTFKFTLF